MSTDDIDKKILELELESRDSIAPKIEKVLLDRIENSFSLTKESSLMKCLKEIIINHFSRG
jgi:hypothetical protein